MRVAFIIRASSFTEKGGDTIQAFQTAHCLLQFGIEVNIFLTTEKINYAQYDLFHFFNIIRPADILYHIHQTDKPFVVSPILVNYSEYDKFHRGGLSGSLFRFLPASRIEYLKVIARYVKSGERIRSFSYLRKGHHQSIREILRKASAILPNSASEYHQLVETYSIPFNSITIPNGVDEGVFHPIDSIEKNPDLILCAARIEGIKNQLNLIKAVNNTRFRLLLIGNGAKNQEAYYRRCKEIAGPNVEFIGQVSQQNLVQYYGQAKVHVLPSWFETCGLSTLEAGAMGCNVVVSNKGYVREYIEDFGYYCDPSSPSSIYAAIEKASKNRVDACLQQKILGNYTWKQAAAQTLKVYNQVLSNR